MASNQNKLAAIVAKALLRRQFQDDLLSNPDLIRAEYGLTKEETKQLVEGFKAFRNEDASPQVLAKRLGTDKWKLP
jgi:hypothetical protein